MNGINTVGVTTNTASKMGVLGTILNKYFEN